MPWTDDQIKKFRIRDALLRRAAQGWTASMAWGSEPYYAEGPLGYIDRESDDDPEVFGIIEEGTEVFYAFTAWNVKSLSYNKGVMELVVDATINPPPDDWKFLYE